MEASHTLRLLVDASELWCWRRLLRVPWTARRSNQSILKEINPKYSLEGLMLKPKLQYFGHLMGRTDSFERTVMLWKIEGGRSRGWQRMRWLDGITDSADMIWVNSGTCWWTGRFGGLPSMGSQRVRHNWVTELNWSLLIYTSMEQYRRRLIFFLPSCHSRIVFSVVFQKILISYLHGKVNK